MLGGVGWGGGYDQLCCPASPKLLLGLDLGLVGNVISNLPQLQLMRKHIKRTLGHTRNYCPCDFRKP